MNDPGEIPGRRCGILCGGGGLRGVSHVGFLEPIFERRIFRVEGGYFGGTSVGSLILAKMSEAQKNEDLLPLLGEVKSIFFDYIDKVGPKAVFPFPPYWWQIPYRVWNSSHILGNETLFKLLKNFNPQKSIESPIVFEFTVFDDRTKCRVTLSNKDERFRRNPELLRQAVVASASLCPIFPAVEVGGNIYRDGGSIDLMSAVRHGCDEIFVLFPYPEKYSEAKADDFFSKHFPLMVDFKSCYAAELRARDADELAKLRDYNELAKLHNKITNERARHRNERANDKKTIIALQDKLASTEKAFSLLGAAGELVGKLKDCATFLKDKLLGTDGPDQEETNDQLMKVVPETVVYGKPPDTLTLTEFRQGVDFHLACQRAREKMECELDKRSR